MTDYQVLSAITNVLNSGVTKVYQCGDSTDANNLATQFRTYRYGAPINVECIDDVVIVSKLRSGT